jgi:hypothetical protein
MARRFVLPAAMKAAEQSSNHLIARARTRRWRILLIIAGMSLLPNCSAALNSILPQIDKLPDKTLNKDQQQVKINEMATRAQTQPSEAAREIESAPRGP